MSPAPRSPHPVVWTILYLPFGALSGFVGVALTFLATRHGLSITEGALLGGASLLSQWLKWMWAPIVDVTLTAKRWYVISTALSALGVLGMSVVPLSPSTLGLLLAVVAVASLVNSVVGMAVESLIASVTPPDQVGRVSAWFQAGNLGGGGLGGGLGLLLLETLPAPWMSGAIMGALFLSCCLALPFTFEERESRGARGVAHPPEEARAHRESSGAIAAVKGVVADLKAMLRTKGGLLAAILCLMPVGTGAAGGVLTQADVAARWSAGAKEVALLQGLVAGIVTAIGCFAGGSLCQRFHPRNAYIGIGLALAAIAAGMAWSPMTVGSYVAWNLAYSFAVGLAYAAFTALVLSAMGLGAAATKYNVFASLSNFPLWWVGLALGWVADRFGPNRMLLAEAAVGIAGVLAFAASARIVNRSALA